jgi:hypothetical protein
MQLAAVISDECRLRSPKTGPKRLWPDQGYPLKNSEFLALLHLLPPLCCEPAFHNVNVPLLAAIGVENGPIFGANIDGRIKLQNNYRRGIAVC